MEEPFLYKGDAPLEWTLSQVCDLIKNLDDMGCLNDLLAEADREGVLVSLPPESVNFVKKFLFQRRLHRTSPAAREIIASAGCGGPPADPATCAPCLPNCVPRFPE